MTSFPVTISGSYVQFVTTTTTGKFQVKYNSGEPANISINNSLVANRTRHYVYQRTGTTGQLIVDGVLYDTGTDNSNYADVGYQIGRYDASNGGASLRMADFRVYSGIQKYSTTGKSVGDKIFNPPSTSPDILPDTPSGVSGGSKLAKITDGAVSFDGTGDYLQVSNSDDFDLGSGDFTWECFAYVNDLDSGTPQWFFSVFSTSSGDNAWGLRLEGNGRLYAYLSTDGSESPVTIGPTLANSGMSDKKWHHLAVVRSGSSSNNITIYVDGISRATGTFNGTRS